MGCCVALPCLFDLACFSSFLLHLSLTCTCTCTYLHVYVQYYRFCSHLQALSTETRQNLFHTFIIHSHTHTSTTHPYHFTHTHTSTTHPYYFTHSHTHTSTTHPYHFTHSHTHTSTTHPYHFTHTHTSTTPLSLHTHSHTTTHPYHRTLILLSSAPRCAMRRRMLTAGWYSTSCPPHTCPTSSTDFISLWRLTTKVPNCCTNCRGLPIDVLFC